MENLWNISINHKPTGVLPNVVNGTTKRYQNGTTFILLQKHTLKEGGKERVQSKALSNVNKPLTHLRTIFHINL